jgi:hypothetical protein
MTEPSTPPVPYMERTRNYYRAMGYAKDYIWAHYEDAPFTPLAKPLAESRIALITTASQKDRANIDAKGVKHVWAGPTATPPDALYTMNLAWDKESTHTDDRESFLPIETMQALATDGRIAGLTDHFFGVPTAYSQRQTIEEDAPDILARIQAEGADAAVLSPL